MKRILVGAILLLAVCYDVNAQTCKIKIYYDANGNRTQRALECMEEGKRPATPMNTISKQQNPFSDLVAGAYQVYPNPAENKVNVKLDANLLAKGCSIMMTDLSGKIIYQHQYVDQTISQFDLQGLADGAYFIIITTGTEKHTVKVVKQN